MLFLTSSLASEFCISRPPSDYYSGELHGFDGVPGTCETVQFVSGMVLEKRDEDNGHDVVISYGIMDCGSGVVKIKLEDILEDLLPI